MDIEMKELVEKDEKLWKKIDGLKPDECINTASKHLQSLRKVGEKIRELNQRKQLSFMARKWGRFLSGKTGNFFSVGLEPFKEIVKPPYKFLNAFGQEDEDIFFGRDQEIKSFLEQLANGRITLLFGKSGVGKTSFLLAGIFPRVRERGYLPIYLRCGENTEKSIKRAVLLNAEKEAIVLENKEELYHIPEEELNRLIVNVYRFVDKELVIAIDQFEEFFILLGDSTRNRFVNSLNNLINDKNIKVKIILSFREEFLAEFHNLAFDMPDIFNNRFRLVELSRQMAVNAITKPLEIVNLKMEEELLKEIVDDLAKNGSVVPPQLQIVCFTLYTTIKDDQKLITRDDMRSLRGVKGILAAYVDFALAPLSNELREKAKIVLKTMVTGQYSRTALNESNIWKLKYKDKPIEKADLDFIISALIERRLIVKIESDEETGEEVRYELTHEYIIEKIKDWIDAEVLKIKIIEDILRQEENNWINLRVARDKDKYKKIFELRDHVELDGKRLGLMLRMSIEQGLDLEYWIERNLDNPQALEFLNDGLDDKNEEVNLEIIRNSLTAIILVYKGILNERTDILEKLSKYGNPGILKIILDFNKEHNNRIENQSIAKLRAAIEKRKIEHMTFVPRGEFKAGFKSGFLEVLDKKIKNRLMDKEWAKNEYPEQPKETQEDILIAKFLVTNEEYKELNTGHIFQKKLEKHPATSVSWKDAKNYTEWLGGDLPEELEWEKAAQGKDVRLFPWGDEWDKDKCNTKVSGISGTTPVNQYKNGRSPYGCYDMAGNVWEWTKTWREQGKKIIVRGGSWTTEDILPWCAYKYDYDADEGMQNVGFRYVRRIKNSTDSNIVYSAGGLCFREINGKRMLLLGNEGDESGTESWRIPKGTIEENESVVECVKREVREETGYSVKIVGFIGCANWSYERNQKILDEIALFFVLEPAQKERKEPDGEFTEVKWFEINEAIEILKFDSDREIASKALDVYNYNKNLESNNGKLYDES